MSAPENNLLEDPRTRLACLAACGISVIAEHLCSAPDLENVPAVVLRLLLRRINDLAGAVIATADPNDDPAAIRERVFGEDYPDSPAAAAGDVQ